MVAELQYNLTRRQRLIPHIRAWGLSQLLVILGVIGVGFAVDRGSWWIALFAALFVLWFGRGYLAGLWNVLFVKLQHMDIVIEDKGLGYMVGKERWYIFLDGLTAVRDLERTVWTIQHWNGTVVNIPKTMLSEDALNFLRDWVGGFKWLAQSARLAMGQGLCEASGSIAKPNRKPYEPLQPPDPRATLHP